MYCGGDPYDAEQADLNNALTSVLFVCGCGDCKPVVATKEDHRASERRGHIHGHKSVTLHTERTLSAQTESTPEENEAEDSFQKINARRIWTTSQLRDNKSSGNVQ